MKERPVTRIEVVSLEPSHVTLKVTWIPSETNHLMTLRPGDTATVNAQWDKAPEPGEVHGAVFVDAEGKRHFRMRAEPGVYDMGLSKLGRADDE